MEINTPVVGGLKNQAIFFGRKIKVFISSICGIEVSWKSKFQFQ